MKASQLFGYNDDDPIMDRLAGTFNSPLLLASLGLLDQGVPGMIQGMRQGMSFNQQQAQMAQQQAQMEQQQQLRQGLSQANAMVPDPNYRYKTAAEGGGPLRPPSVENPNRTREIATSFMAHGNPQQQMFGATLANKLDEQALHNGKDPKAEARHQEWLLKEAYKDRRAREQRAHEMRKLEYSIGNQNRRFQISETNKLNRASAAEDGRMERAEGQLGMSRLKMKAKKKEIQANKLAELREASAKLESLSELTKSAAHHVGNSWSNMMGWTAETFGGPLGIGQSNRELRRISNRGIIDLVSKLPGHLSDKELKFLGEIIPSANDHDNEWYRYTIKANRSIANTYRKMADEAEMLGDLKAANEYSMRAKKADRAADLMSKDTGVRGL